MTAGSEKLRKAQLGQEGTAGTEANATVIWLGSVEPDDNREAVFPDENVGYFCEVDHSYIPYADGTINFAENDASFEQIGYPLSACMNGGVSGSANGGTSNAYKYTWTAPTTAAPTTQAYTIETGDDYQEYQGLYGFCQEWSLKGSPKQSVKSSSKWGSRSIEKGTFTNSLTPPPVEELLFQLGKIYCDAVGGTIGSTQLTNTWVGFNVKYDSGLRAQATGDGSISFSFVKFVKPSFTGDITFLHDAVGVARYDDFKANTTKQFRMLFEGSATGFTGAGGTYAKRTVAVDFCAKIKSVKILDSVDGIDTVKATIQGVYNSTANLFLKVSACNLLSALT